MIAGADPHSPSELRALTGIRGIAAWLVVFYHARLLLTDWLPASVITVLGKGYLAVDLFFMLSGFVMWYNYAPRFRRGGFAETPAYLWRRIARIWPLHIAILSTMAAFAAFLAATSRDYGAYPFGELPLHLLLLQNWGFTAELAWNHPAWSISTEFAAYVVFPLAVCTARWEDLRNPAIMAAIGLLLGVLYAVFAVNGYGTLGDAIPQMGLIRCLCEFAIGNLLCILWLRLRSQPGGPLLALAAALAFLGAGLGFGIPETAYVPAVLAAGLLALALDTGAIGRVCGSRLPYWLGEVSYSTYLAHFFLLILFKLFFVDTSLQLGPAGLTAYLAIVLFASVALFRGVEKPAQRWLNARPLWFAASGAATRG